MREFAALKIDRSLSSACRVRPDKRWPFREESPIKAGRMDGGKSKLGPVQAKQSTRIGHLYAVYAGRAGMPHTRNQPRYIQNNTGHR